MTFSERMKDLLEQGWAVTKEAAVKAGAKAQDLGERGLLMWDIKQLENHAQKQLARLGTEVYLSFTEKGETSITADSAEIKTILDEISKIKDSIERKEAELKLRKG